MTTRTVKTSMNMHKTRGVPLRRVLALALAGSCAWRSAC